MAWSGWRLWLLVGGLATLAYLTLPAGPWRVAASTLTGLAALAAVLGGVATQPRAGRAPWLLVAGALAAFLLGHALLAAWGWRAPSPADALDVAADLLLAGALVLLGGRTWGGRRAHLVDAAVVATGPGCSAGRWSWSRSPGARSRPRPRSSGSRTRSSTCCSWGSPPG